MPIWILATSVLMACNTPETTPTDPAEGAARVADQEALFSSARKALKAVGGGLRSRLKAVMTEEGPEAAVRVCADEAQTLTRTLAEEAGVKAGRSSLRLRNPTNAAPTWVSAWLTAQGERPAAEAQGFERIEGTGDARVARVLKPIPIEPVCLTCHGPAEAIPEPVRTVLADRYPTDAATGYAVGDLRGAAWAEATIVEP